MGLPFTIRTGHDVQSIAEFRKAWEETPSILDGFFLPSEKEYVRRRYDRYADQCAAFAARCAAKEAVMKLIGRKCDWHDIELTFTDGRPSAAVAQGALQDLTFTIDSLDISFSHSGDVASAIAVALVVRKEGKPHE